LITGGAGFVGSHLADELLEHGYEVRALDNLSPQVHQGGQRPDYLSPEVELIVGDVRNPDDVRRALSGVDHVYHFAAMVGVGQSMYQIREYTSVNSLGTAVLLEQMSGHQIGRLVVASSMSLYGEGLYRNPEGELVPGPERALDQLRRHEWEVRDDQGRELVPVPTAESKIPSLPSVYAIGKFEQERLCLTIGRAYGIDVVALRFFNIYGTRQALSNPYTGVLAIFASRLLNGNPPLIFEDGRQKRDFVSVRDVTRACRLALESPDAAGEVLNIGSGRAYTVLEIASSLSEVLGREIEPEVTSRYRMGDIRHCFADISLARRVLGYEPQVELADGLGELSRWLEGQVAIDHVAKASRELAERGLRV
jgi:dTDP-L-rhamnose 4-epimerase